MVWSNERRTFAVETYFSQSLYRSGAACVLYSLPNPPSGPSTGPKIHSVVGWERQGNGKCVKKEEDDHGPHEHQRTSRLSDGPFCSLPGALHANIRLPLASQIVLFVEFFTKTATSILTRWVLFKNLHNGTGLIEQRHVNAWSKGCLTMPLSFFLVMKRISIFQAVLISKTSVTGAMWFKTSHAVVSESKNKIFVSRWFKI